MNWRTADRFPVVSDDGWQATASSITGSIVGRSAVEKAIRSWHPLHPMLVAVPGAQRLLPPIAIDEINEPTHKAFLYRSRLSIEIASLCAALALLAARELGSSDGVQVCYLLSGLVAFLLADYWFVFRSLDAITERSMFSFWVRETARVDVMLWSGLMVVVGGLQLWGESIFGGLQPLVGKYGASFDALDQGEVWRLLSGPFIHLNFAHWGTNAAMAIFIAMIAAKISRIQTAAVFLCGSAAGVLITWLGGADYFGSYLGVSAGVMAMLGLCGGAAWRAPRNFPIRFAFTFITLGLLNIYLAWIYSPASANAAHAVGLFLGFIWGVVLQDRILRNAHRPGQSADFPAAVA